jgi:ribonuclease Z
VSTEVVILGTGVPHASAGRAGAAVLVVTGDVRLLFDAGRATVLRLAEAGVRCGQLDAVLLTHLHSDHVVGLPDVVLTRWVESALHPLTGASIVAPEGPTAEFARRMLDPYAADIAAREAHTGRTFAAVDVHGFQPRATPTTVWRSDAHPHIEVEAVAVHHEPVPDAVAYRVGTPDGTIVISGDTRVCAEVEALTRGAEVLVHEVARTHALGPAISGTAFEAIFDYHADSVELGAMAARAGVPHLVLTHLIPQPDTPEAEHGFLEDLRDGGFEGRVTVARDLVRIGL